MDERTKTLIDRLRKFKVKRYIDKTELKEDLKIMDSRLNDAYFKQASLLSYYASQRAEAAYQEELLRQKVEWLEAMLDKDIRQDALDENRKITESAIDKGIKSDARYIEVSTLYLQAKREHLIAKGAVDSFNHRRDMLIQAGADARQEHKGELRVQERNSVGSVAPQNDAAARYRERQRQKAAKAAKS